MNPNEIKRCIDKRMQKYLDEFTGAQAAWDVYHDMIKGRDISVHYLTPEEKQISSKAVHHTFRLWDGCFRLKRLRNRLAKRIQRYQAKNEHSIAVELLPHVYQRHKSLQELVEAMQVRKQ